MGEWSESHNERSNLPRLRHFKLPMTVTSVVRGCEDKQCAVSLFSFLVLVVAWCLWIQSRAATWRVPIWEA